MKSKKEVKQWARLTIRLPKADKEKLDAYADSRRKTTATVVMEALLPIIAPELIQNERASN